MVSKNGNVKILEWWKNSGLEYTNSKPALDWASYYGHIEVLEWRINSGLELEYFEDLLLSNGLSRAVSREVSIEVLEWWRKLSIILKLL